MHIIQYTSWWVQSLIRIQRTSWQYLKIRGNTNQKNRSTWQVSTQLDNNMRKSIRRHPQIKREHDFPNIFLRGVNTCVWNPLKSKAGVFDDQYSNMTNGSLDGPTGFRLQVIELRSKPLSNWEWKTNDSDKSLKRPVLSSKALAFHMPAGIKLCPGHLLQTNYLWWSWVQWKPIDEVKGSFYFITLPHACKGAPSKGLQRVWSCPFRCIPCCMHDAFNTFATLSVSVHVNSCHVTTLMFLQLLRGPPFHRSRCQDCHCHRLDGKLWGAWPLAPHYYKLFQEMQAFPQMHIALLKSLHKSQGYQVVEV